MAWLVTSEGTAWGGNSSAIWDPSSIELCTLMVYSDFTRLCGYFIGQPTPVGGDTWRMEITLYDYDFSSLYEQQKRDLRAPHSPQSIASGAGGNQRRSLVHRQLLSYRQ